MVKSPNCSEHAVRKVLSKVPTSRTNSSRQLEEPTETSLRPIQHLGRVFPWSRDLRMMDSRLRWLLSRYIHGHVLIAACHPTFKRRLESHPVPLSTGSAGSLSILVLPDMNPRAGESITRSQARGSGFRVGRAERRDGATVSTIGCKMEEIVDHQSVISTSDETEQMVVAARGRYVDLVG